MAVTYVVREDGRESFLQLTKDLESRTRHLLALAGGDGQAYSMIESSVHRGRFVELVSFTTPQEYAKFDDLYNQDRVTTALQALLEETLELARCDYVITRQSG